MHLTPMLLRMDGVPPISPLKNPAIYMTPTTYERVTVSIIMHRANGLRLSGKTHALNSLNLASTRRLTAPLLCPKSFRSKFSVTM